MLCEDLWRDITLLLSAPQLRQMWRKLRAGLCILTHSSMFPNFRVSQLTEWRSERSRIVFRGEMEFFLSNIVWFTSTIQQPFIRRKFACLKIKSVSSRFPVRAVRADRAPPSWIFYVTFETWRKYISLFGVICGCHGNTFAWSCKSVDKLNNPKVTL